MGIGQLHAVYISCNYFLCVFVWILIKYFLELSTYLIYFKGKKGNDFVSTGKSESKGEQCTLRFRVQTWPEDSPEERPNH